jgi:hypothetical protein
MNGKMAKIKLVSETQLRDPFGNFPEVLKRVVNRDRQLGLGLTQNALIWTRSTVALFLL